MTENATTLSPGLVLSIGRLGNRMAVEAQTLLLRSDPWRVRAVKFLTLVCTQDGFSWAQTRAGRARQAFEQSRAQVCGGMLKSATNWQAGLENALHELRSHGKLLESGWNEKSIQALRIIVLADLCEADAAAVFPLVVELQSLLAREPYARLSLLLSVADFTPVKTRPEALAHRAVNLDDLYSLCSQKSPLRERLATALGLQTLTQPSAQVYLFDRYKEGGWEVRNEAELGVIMENFMLALLLNEADRFDPTGMQTDEPLYHSAGASALIYDPAELMEACAARLGAEILRTEFGTEALPDLRAIHQILAELAGLYDDPSTSSGQAPSTALRQAPSTALRQAPSTALRQAQDVSSHVPATPVQAGQGLRGWLASLLEETPFTLRAGAEPEVDIHFADLSFDDLPLEEWGDAICGHDRYFGEQVFPAARERLLTNAQRLSAAVSGAQADALEVLPQRERLYPGGLAAARKVLELLGLSLQERLAAYPVTDETSALEQALQGKVDIALKLLDQAVESLPQPPRWFRLAPFPLNRLARFLFALFYQRRELAHLLLLRQDAIRAVEQKYAELLERDARQQIHKLCQNLLEALKQGDNELQIFQAALYSAQLRLEKRAGLPGRLETPFRQPAVTRAVYEWAFARGQKPAGELRLLLLEEYSLLANWKALDARKLETALLSFTRDLYQFTWQISLDEILAQRGSPDLQELWTVLSQGATPLLRPDFDQGAAGGQALQGQFFLCQSARSSPFAPYLRGPLTGWQAHSTGDPYLAFCVRLRQGLPFQALGFLREKPAGEREGLALFDGETECAK